MYFLIIILPVLSSIAAGLFGYFIGKKGAQLLSTTLLFISMILSILMFVNVTLNGNYTYLTVGS